MRIVLTVWQTIFLETIVLKISLTSITEILIISLIARARRSLVSRGITQVVKKHGDTNNKYMEDYDGSKPSRYLQYLDANNLYGWAMSQPLPTGGFKWVDVKANEIKKLLNRKDKGYLLEVDVSYPFGLHDKHRDLPFMCSKMKVGGVEKLIADLRDKKRYVINIRALQQALEHGLVLEKIHRVIEFKQSPWMKEYIAFNTKLRTAAANDLEKDFYKLMNNAVIWKNYGKTFANKEP